MFSFPIPIFIIVHDRLEILQRCVASFQKYITSTPIELVFHDVASTYPPTVAWLEKQKETGHRVTRSERNDHLSVFQSVAQYLREHPECLYYVVTDPDIELDNVRGDILEFYAHLLGALQVQSVGPMLRIDDLPDHYPRKHDVIASHRRQFWNRRRQSITYQSQTFEYVRCSIDTTFQMRQRDNLKRGEVRNSVRCLAPYAARHLDWYLNPYNLSPCQAYYAQHASAVAHWSNPRWKRARAFADKTSQEDSPPQVSLNA